MVLMRATAIAAAVIGVAVGLAATASAEDRLDGTYTLVNGPTTNTWVITTFCNPEVTCSGTLSSSTGLIAEISRTAGGPWVVSRHDVPNGWPCPAGGTGPADVVYSFDPASLAGTVSYTSKPGACNEPNSVHTENPVSLIPA